MKGLNAAMKGTFYSATQRNRKRNNVRVRKGESRMSRVKHEDGILPCYIPTA